MNLEKKAIIESPYLAARAEWNERYGSFIASANSWKMIALISLFIAFISVGGVIYFANQTQFKPHIVEINPEGEILTVYGAEQMQNIDNRVVRSQLAHFIKSLRNVSSDLMLQKELVFDTYAYVPNTSPAFFTMNEYFKTNNPFERSQEELVVVEIYQVLPVTNDTWRIEWVERIRNSKGNKGAKTRWIATATIEMGQVLAKDMTRNPTGLQITHLDIAQNFELNVD